MDTKTRIKSESLNIFARKGYDGTSMTDIAQSVGIRKASLYSHYCGKEEIFNAVFGMIVENHLIYLADLKRKIENMDPYHKLEEIFKGYVRHCRNNTEMDFWNRFYYFPPDDLKELILEKTREVEAEMEGIINRIFSEATENGKIRKTEIRKTGLSFYYMLLGFMLSLNDYRDRDIEEDLAACFDTFWNGIKTE